MKVSKMNGSNCRVASLEARARARRLRRGSRGLSLVELAIILAAVGIILGGAVVPLYQKKLGDDLDLTRRQLDDIHASIEGYAIRNRTPGLRYVVNVQEYDGMPSAGNFPRSSTSHTYLIPANRPYLPCPDYDGDGLENRLSQINPLAMQQLFGYVTDLKPVRVDNPTGVVADELEPADALYALGGVAQRTLARYGTCGFSAEEGNTDRGALPWRTLGVAHSDKWGTRFTYRVDQIYASGLTGFSQETRLDGYDPRLPMYYNELSSDGRRLMPLRAHWDVGAQGGSASAAYTPPALAPTVVCGLHASSGESGDARYYCDPLPRAATFTGVKEAEATGLLAGSVATVAAEWGPDSVRPVPFPSNELPGLSFPGGVGLDQAGAVREGVPYVVLSHGSNRLFGLDHRTLSEELPQLSQPSPCLWQATNRAEHVGADFEANPNLASPGEAHNSPCAVRYAGGDYYRPGMFYSQPPTYGAAGFQSNEAASTFDDVVEWRTRAQFHDLMTSAGVFPAEPLPLLVTR